VQERFIVHMVLLPISRLVVFMLPIHPINSFRNLIAMATTLPNGMVEVHLMELFLTHMVLL